MDNRPRLLLVDDTPENLRMLIGILGQEYAIGTARDGEQALRLATAATPPDLILLDILMPGLDGYATCRRLKEHPLTREVPVIFATAMTETEDESRGFEAGAVDYLTKPFRPAIVKARVRTHLALRAAYRSLARSNEQLTQEREMVENVILRMRQDRRFFDLGLRLLLSPVERTSGDLLLSARRPDGVQYLLLGDCTGHGLAAAITGPLVSDIFYAMTGKAHPVEEILAEINLKLHLRMPTGTFMAACFLALDWAGGRLEVWNGGMPEVLVYRQDGSLHRFPSNHLALGVRPGHRIAETLATAPITVGDRLYAYSDGFIEAADARGELFGVERLTTFLETVARQGVSLEELPVLVERFRQGAAGEDDMTLVEVTWPSM